MAAAEIGRVLLNLISNAFYAVQQRETQQTNGPYKPTVTVSTCLKESKVEIKIADNGTGIPAEVADKIFQPFFTTKPPGQGTGLGLSLAYDIAKAHGGELGMTTEAGTGTTFTLTLPISE